MKKLFALVATVFTLALPLAAQAHEGFYAGAQGGANWLDFRNRHGSSGGGSHRNNNADVGYLVGGVVGYEFCNNFSAEFEFTYRNNELKRRHHNSGDFFGGGSHRGERDLHTWAFMANGYYDINLDCWCLPVSPYVGVGIGYDVHNKRHRHHGGSFGGSSSGHHDDNGNFAWQVMAGLDYDLCWCGFEDVVLNVEYKFHDSEGKRDRRFYNNSLSFGARKYF